MGKFVQGSYSTLDEAERAIDKVVAEGYAKKLITLVTNHETARSIPDSLGVGINTEHAKKDKEDESFMEKVKDAFTPDEDEVDTTDMGYQADEEILGTYKADIENGKIIVLVDDFDDEKGAVDFEGATPNAASVPPVSDDLDQGKEKIDLKAERLDVGTKEVQTGEVTVDKTVTEEMKTIEVPVKHEEITVERHPVADGESVEGSLDMKDEEITIPVKEEQIEVTKRPVVTEEVTIGKDTTEEVKQVSEQVRKEDLDIHTSGDVEVNDEDESKKNL